MFGERKTRRVKGLRREGQKKKERNKSVEFWSKEEAFQESKLLNFIGSYIVGVFTVTSVT